MKEHPSLFTTEMVRAILDGRKIQTRRVPIERYRNWKVGDRIWVRENIRLLVYNQRNHKIWQYGEFLIEFIADRTIIKCPDELEEWWRRNWRKRPATTIPSIHMPKWAARIWLEITGLRVERVQDISVEDEEAEGIVVPHRWNINGHERCIFGLLWDSINYKRGYGWDKNPEVKVIEFKRL